MVNIPVSAYTRSCRGAESDGTPPGFLVAPASCIRAGVRRFHSEGRAAATNYLQQSKVTEWADHRNRSMATNSRRLLAGADWYMDRAATDPRPLVALGQKLEVTVGDVAMTATLDVVLGDDDRVGGRVVLWDGLNFDDHDADLIAYPFALALRDMYPERELTTIGIWQGRWGHAVEVDVAQALRRRTDAERITSSLAGQ